MAVGRPRPCRARAFAQEEQSQRIAKSGFFSRSVGPGGGGRGCGWVPETNFFCEYLVFSLFDPYFWVPRNPPPEVGVSRTTLGLKKKLVPSSFCYHCQTLQVGSKEMPDSLVSQPPMSGLLAVSSRFSFSFSLHNNHSNPSGIFKESPYTQKHNVFVVLNSKLHLLQMRVFLVLSFPKLALYFGCF